jgi:TetR/AcrR family transcriptional regulator
VTPPNPTSRPQAGPGRRERNKQDKLGRIMAAATALFAEHGVGEVTTQQIADRADIGTGTLFLYARTKGELLLMVQNSLYAESLAKGKAAAENVREPVRALMSILEPIIHCNRAQVENGRTYLRELAFGEPSEPHRAAALAIVAETSEALASTLVRTKVAGPADATTIAGLIEARTFLALAASGPDVPVDDVIEQVGQGVALLVRLGPMRRPGDRRVEPRTIGGAEGI